MIYIIFRLLLSMCFLFLLTSCFSDVGSSSSAEKAEETLSLSFKINEGNEFTNQDTISLNLIYNKLVTHIVIADSQSACESSEAWEPVSLSVDHSLNQLNALNQIWMKAKSAQGDATSCKKQEITHDNQAPSELNGFESIVPSTGPSTLRSPEVNWTSANDQGPSGIDFYEARIMREYDNMPQTQWLKIELTQALSNIALYSGKVYYMETRAVDKAGNKGPASRSPLWSDGLYAKEIFYEIRAPNIIKKADMNGDNKTDIVLATESFSNVYLLSSRGDATFETLLIHKSFAEIEDIQLADIDSDGDMDIVVAESAPSSFYILMSEGRGIYVKKLISISSFSKIQIADMNNDSKLDIVGISLYSAAYFINQGKLSFTKFDYTTNGHTMDGLSLNDLDQDGHIDILIAQRAASKLVWARNLQNSNFAAMSDLASYNLATDIKAVDLDEDGILDIIGSSYSSYRITWFKHDGSLGFTPTDLTTTADNVRDYEIIDIDKDNDLDIIFPDQYSNKFSMLRNNGSEVFAASDVVTMNSASLVLAFDANSDTEVDLITIREYADGVFVSLNNGSENFTTNDIFNLYKLPEALDLNADGKEDLLVLSASGLQFNKLMNNSTGYDAAVALGPVISAAVTDYQLIDMEPDGDIDIVYNTSSRVAWLRNNGDTTYTDIAIAASVTTLRKVVASDIDKDGDVDVLYGSVNNVILRTNNGSEVFSTTTLITFTGYAAQEIEIVDIDGDNDNDLVFVYQQATVGPLKIYYNNGSMVFTNSDVTTGLEWMKWARTADVDNDGDLDIVLSKEYGGAIYLLENDGSQNFSVTPLASSNNISKIRLVDIDGDSDVDILYANSNEGELKILRNLGSNTFAVKTLMAGLQNPGSFVVSNVDATGKPEVISMIKAEKSYTIFRQD